MEVLHERNHHFHRSGSPKSSGAVQRTPERERRSFFSKVFSTMSGWMWTWLFSYPETMI